MVNKIISINEIKKIIGAIPDPEIPVISINELGILREVEFDNDECLITITPTYTACPAMQFIEEEIKDRLGEIGINNVKVKLTYSPAWTTDWINENTKQKLKNYGIAAPLHSSCNKVFQKNVMMNCPHCNSTTTELISRFGSTACKALYKCNTCKEPFEYFKCH
ncbi:MAG: phenylacetate-CoA oxygenase subunit PaaJ [Bacteroidia bacterium]|nr:phenylacetate-CoA oxygenase subunit PaaJ [Bacteroidia bacterium]